MNTILNYINRIIKVLNYRLDLLLNKKFLETKEYKEDLVAFLELLQYQKKVILLGGILKDEAGIYYYNGTYTSLDKVIRLFQKQWINSHNSLNINKEIEKVKKDLELYQ